MIAQIRITCMIALSSILCLTVIGGSFLSANAQQPDSNRLPILLIHGYGEDSGIWNLWEEWLAGNHFTKVYPITFQSNDQCGSVEQHAMELKDIVNKILSDTGYQKVNIVTHSKGGLDARWYIASSGSVDKVAKLIMIGTPNAGSPAAFIDITGCPPGSDSDLLPGSEATQVQDNPENTKYYTIAGNWLPNNVACMGLDDGGNCFIPGEDDGLVAVRSVDSSPDYISLGQPFPYYHTELVAHKDVYGRVLPILNR